MYLLIIFIHLLILSVGAVGSNSTDGGDGNDKLDICLISYYQNLEFKYLNLGALKNTHPNPKYINYIGINPPGKFQNKIIDLETEYYSSNTISNSLYISFLNL